ncbi:MAG: multiheme c-type cytochrome [Planctomycetota bacterium]
MQSRAMDPTEAQRKRWSYHLAYLSTGLLIFETLTGLIIYLLPFSLTTQFSVLLHTAVGLPFLVPMTWYSIRHWLDYRGYAMNHYKASGYATLLALLVCAVSGAVLTVQAVFGRRISYAWDTVHIVSTFATLAFVLPHVVLLVVRQKKRELDSSVRLAALRYVRRSLGTALACCVLLVMAVVSYVETPLSNEFPGDYVYKWGKERPFAPSLASTESGGAYDTRTLAGSKNCGTAGCHEEIYAEWSVSAHRWSAMDAAFQTVQEVMGKQNGPESTRYCGGCHDPISLFSGSKNIFTENLTNLAGYQEGVSCLICHGVRKTDLKGNANYQVAQLTRYAFELEEGPVSKFLSDVLIRAYPRYHTATLSKRLFKTPEYCAACHKQFIDEEVNEVGWVQLQNQYDNWRKSRWNHPGHADRTIECRECHMPLVDSRDPASGDDLDYNRSADDGKHRSHRFVGANQLMPALLKLDGADEQIRLTEKWLRGESEIPEIAHKWKKGPAVPIDLVVPDSVKPGGSIPVKVNIVSNKVGHDFPTGPLDIIQAWIELEVTDDTGAVVYHSGTVNERNFIEPGSFLFKVEAVDRSGNLIDRHNLWEMVGVRYRRSLFPGFADAAEYDFNCPSTLPEKQKKTLENREFAVEIPEGALGRLHVKARLRYRKIDQFLLNFLFGEDTKLTSPITDMAEDEATITVMTD